VRPRGLLLAGALAVFVLPAGSARAGDPIMPLSQVRQGMRCTALSVVQGTTITSFQADVVDVVTGDPHAVGPRILVRVSGAAVDATGVGAGFSGTPLLCPDGHGVQRNAGAISEDVGDFGNHLVLATPIEQMLGQPAYPPSSARRDPALLAKGRRLSEPLTVSGLSAPMRRMVDRTARRSGRPILTAPSGPFGGFPVQELRPGSAVATGMSTGDIGLTSIGTVTYRDGPSVWVFGHELDGVGRRSLPLLDAYVFAVVGNPVGIEGAKTYKFEVGGHTVGAFTNDTPNAGAGRVGPPPRMIPFNTTLRDESTGKSLTIRTQVSDERLLDLGSGLGPVGTLALGQGTFQVLGHTPPRLSGRMCLRISVLERPRPLGFCGTFLNVVEPLDDATRAFDLVDSFKFGRLTPVAVSARVGLRPDTPEAFILRARGPRRARRGQRLRIRLLLQRPRAGRERMTVFYRVPRRTRPGPHMLTIRGTVPRRPEVSFQEHIDNVFEPDVEPGRGEEPGPRSMAQLAAEIAALRHSDGLRATFSRLARGPVVLSTSNLLVRGRVRLPVRIVGR
jgi:hypothetical protein